MSGKLILSWMGVLGVALALAPGVAAVHAAPSPAANTGAGKSVSAASSARKNDDTTEPRKRPFTVTFRGGMTTSPKDPNVYIFRGLPDQPGKWVSRDTTITMMNFEWNAKTHVGVGTGDPHLDDPHNAMTGDKITIIDDDPHNKHEAILDGHVHVIHHPDSQTDPENQAQFGEVFTHDVTLTCDHAEYYYRLKTGSATGHLLMVGQDKQNDKPVKADLTADRLEFEDRNNIYRAIGSVVIHDGDTTATTPELDTVTEMKDGKRQVQSVTMAGPFESTGLFDDSDETDSSAAARGTTTPAGSGNASAVPNTPTPATPAPATPAPSNPAPSNPAPTTPTPTTPPPPGGGTPAKIAAKGAGGS